MACLVDHTRRLMLRYQAGRDGLTGCELHSGEPAVPQTAGGFEDG